MELLKRETPLMFMGSKKLPKHTVEKDDEVTLKTDKLSFRVKVNKIEENKYEGTVLGGGAYPNYEPNDTICFELDNIFVCDKVNSR